MAAKKFNTLDRVIGKEEGPASFRGRIGIVVDFKGRGGYGVLFEDAPGITEYLNSDWLNPWSQEQRIGS